MNEEPLVSCPNCGQQQPVDQFNSYRCDSCDEVWALCTVCSKVLSGDGPDTYRTRYRPLCRSCYLGGEIAELKKQLKGLRELQKERKAEIKKLKEDIEAAGGVFIEE